MYNFKKIEKKWQEYWDKNKTFKTAIIGFDNGSTKRVKNVK